MTKFKLEHSIDQRKAESSRIRAKYADRIPVICERSDKSKVQDIDKKKYLVPADLTVSQFMYVIRKVKWINDEIKNLLCTCSCSLSLLTYLYSFMS